MGLRNRSNAKRLLDADAINIDQFTDFGRNNKDGYGDYFYRGPLSKLKILWREDSRIVVSPAGEMIDDIFERSIAPSATSFWQKSLSSQTISQLSNACVCRPSNNEKEIWRSIFFGLTKEGERGLEIDYSAIQDYFDSKLTVPTSDFDFSNVDEEDFARPDYARIAPLVAGSKDEERRRFTLLMILKIISKTNPVVRPTDQMNQTIRDAIYYNAAYRIDGKIKEIDFGQLEKWRSYWEVYVHNLYYISIWEKALDLLLNAAASYPEGIAIESIAKSTVIDKVIKFIQKNGLNLKPGDNIETASDELIGILSDGRSSLAKIPNENKILSLMRSSSEINESFANMILLFLLCQVRFNSFNQEQMKTFSYREKRQLSIKPSSIYDKFSRLSISDLPLTIFDVVKKQHRFASAKKFQVSGTKAWLFTEEDGLIYFYGKHYPLDAYREAKWRQVVELMMDLGLVKKVAIGDHVCWEVTAEGEKWLHPMQ